MRRIDGVEALERVVGAPPLSFLMKSIPELDEHCAAILELSPIAVVGYRDEAGRQRAQLVGGTPGFAAPTGPTGLSLPTPADAADGSAISTVFLVPGWREALRINGRRAGSEPDALRVDEALVHCGKAVLRSRLWQGDATGSGTGPPSSPAELLARCPFVVLTSQDPHHGADASPKGDPPGFVHRIDDHTIAIPDRRGNRRTDTLHNLMADPRVALLGIAPGVDDVVEVIGRAQVTDDAELCAAMAIDGKAPKDAIVIAIEQAELTPSPALVDSQLWERAPAAEVDLPPAGRIWSDHVKRNDTRGVKASVVRSGANGALVQAGAELDYKRLY